MPNPTYGAVTTTTDPKEAVQTVIDDIGVGPFQHRLFVAGSLGGTCLTLWLLGIAVMGPRFQDAFLVSDKQVGIVSSANMSGMLVGALFWGFLADSRGRRLPFLLCPAVATLAGFSIALAPSFLMLCIATTLLGFSISGYAPIDAAFFTEFLPRTRRSLIVLMSTFFTLGSVFIYLACLLILPTYSCPKAPNPSLPPPPCSDPQRNGWRYVLLLVSSFQALTFIIRLLLCRIPESPIYLVSRGRYAEASHVLLLMSRANKHASPPPSLIAFTEDYVNGPPLDINAFLPDLVKKSPSVITTAFASRPLAITTILIPLYSILLSFGYYLSQYYLPIYLERRSQLPGAPPGASDSHTRYTHLLISSLFGIPASLLARYLIDTWIGRRGTFSLSFLLTGASFFAFTAPSSPLFLLTAMSLSVFTSTMIFSISRTYIAEVYPAQVRASIGGMVGVVQRIASILSPSAATFLLPIGLTAPFIMAAACMTGGAILTLSLPIETRPRPISREDEISP